MTDIDLDIRMCFVKAFQSFRSCYDTHEFDVFSALFFHKVNGCFCRASGCKHWVYDNCNSFINGFRKLAVVFVRFMCYRIAVKSYVSNLCRRYKCKDAVYHSQTSAEYRNHCQLLS